MKDYSPLNVFSDQQEVKHQGQTGWVFQWFLQPCLLRMLVPELVFFAVMRVYVSF